MADHLTIALVFNYALDYCRGVLRGVREFARARENWVFTPVPSNPGAAGALARRPPDGVIAHVSSRELAEALRHLRRPTVNVSSVLLDLPFPRVAADNFLVGRAAAEHLRERGLRRFAFIGHASHGYSKEREAGFRDGLGQGAEVHVYQAPAPSRFDPVATLSAPAGPLERWAAALPRPVGVFTCNDVWGFKLSEVCRRLRLRVPDDVAIVGVDNDDLLCELSRPSLSSVAVPTERVGYAAAEMLERLMESTGGGNGRERPMRVASPLLLPPAGVVTRQSSDVLAIDDEDLATAIRFIRRNCERPIGVRDVLSEVPVSRRALERKFRLFRGHGPSHEIRRAHVERAQSLLAGTELQMPAVAERSGFASAKHLCVVFHAETGMTPTGYRQRFRRLAPRESPDGTGGTPGRARRLERPGGRVTL